MFTLGLFLGIITIPKSYLPSCGVSLIGDQSRIYLELYSSETFSNVLGTLPYDITF